MDNKNWVKSLRQETERVAREYEKLIEQRQSLLRDTLKLGREIFLLNALLEYHGKEPIKFEV